MRWRSIGLRERHSPTRSCSHQQVDGTGRSIAYSTPRSTRARGLLALKRVDSSRHSGVIALFQEHFVKTGAVPPDVARALRQAFAKRQLGDYDDFADVEELEFRSLREQVERLVVACEDSVNRARAVSHLWRSARGA